MPTDLCHVCLYQDIIMMFIVAKNLHKQWMYGDYQSKRGYRGKHNNMVPRRPREREDIKVFVIKNKYTRNFLPIQSENFARHGQPWPSIVAFRKPKEAQQYIKRYVNIGRFLRFQHPSQHLIYEPILFEDILFICHYLAVVHLTIFEADGKMRTFPCRYENDMETQRMALAFLLSYDLKNTF